MPEPQPKDGLSIVELSDIMRRWSKGTNYIPYHERSEVIRYAAIGIVVSRFMDGERPLNELVREALTELDQTT